MALQLRRGTASQRLLSGVIPSTGELLYTTDDNNLYIGDGVTEGGVLVTQKIGGYDVEGTFQRFFLISSTSRTGGFATYITADSHALQAGDEVVISEADDPTLNGTFTVYDVTGVTEFRVNTGGADLPTQGPAIYMLSAAAFPNGAAITWSDADQQFEVRSLTKADVGLANVDNTSDVNKPVSTAQRAAIDAQKLEEHSDVFINSVTEGQVLAWSIADQAWVNVTGGGGGGGGSADFPETYFPYAGIGQHPAGVWLSSSEMFKYVSDSATAYKSFDSDPILLEYLEWNNQRAITNSETAWKALEKTAGDWAFIFDPQAYNISQTRAYTPSSKRNANLTTWIRGQGAYSNKTFGKYTWEEGVTYYNEEFSVESRGEGTYLNYFPSHTLYNTGRPNPPLGSDHTFQEFSFVNGYSESAGKFVGPSTYETRYASQAAAEADGWTTVQWGIYSTARYYPGATDPNGTGGITLPFSWTFGGSVIQKIVFSSTGGLLFLPAGSTAYLYPTNASGGSVNGYDPLTTRWASAVNQFYLALGELGVNTGAAQQCIYKVVNEAPHRVMVFRWTMNLDAFQVVVEFSIRESNSEFQVLISPLYNSAGQTIADRLEATKTSYSASRLKLAYGIVQGGGTYVTHSGALCDSFNMNCHPYVCTDGQAKWIKRYSFTRNYLKPLLSAMGDVTDGAVGSVLTRTGSGYSFTTGTLIGNILTDTSLTVLGEWSYSTIASWTNGNGYYYWFDPSTSYIDVQLNRRDSTGTDRYSIMIAWTSSTVLKVTVNGIAYTLKLFQTPTYQSNVSYQLFQVRLSYIEYDGPAFKAAMANFADRQNVAFAPTITATTPATNGQVLTYNSTTQKWSPATPSGISDGDKGDITVSGSGATWTIDADVVTNAKAANMAVNTIKGRATAGTGDPEDLTAAQVKTILSLSNVENTALSTWAGSANLTTLGTVGTGTWNATTISIAKGGTGQTTASGAINALLPAQSGNSGKYLTTNGTAASWATISSGATNLNGLSDVTITSATTGEVLRYNGSQWVDAQLGYSDLSGLPTLVTNLNGLSDVTITAAATGEVLRYNGSQWIDAQLGYSDLSGAPSNVSFFNNDAGYLTDVVLDLTPQLGGNLDVNGKYIVSTSNGNVSIAPDGTGLLEVRGNSNDGAIRLNCTANTHGVTIKSPPHAAAATYTLVLPTSAGLVDQVLRTDGAGNLSWVAQGGGGAANLDDLGDVTITAPSTGEVLRYNGSQWVDAQLSYADLSGVPTALSQFSNDTGFISDITSEPLGDLSNVVLTSPVNGNVLSYNGTNWINTAAPPADISGSSIGQLNDVDTTTSPPVNGEGLIWNSTSGNWEPGTVSAGPVALDDLTDVVITAAVAGEVLRFNGTSWVDAVLDYSDLTGAPSLATVATSGDYDDLINRPAIPSVINDLGDVVITSPASGQILEYNGTSWVNVANSGGGGPTSIDDLTDVDTSTVAPANGQVLKWNGVSWIPGNDNTGGGGSATLGRGDGGDLDFGAVDSAFVFAVYGGGDIDTTTEDKPVEFVSYDVDGGELT